MLSFVIDASVIVKWLNQDREQHTEQAMLLLTGAALGTHRLVTADLALFEVLNALIRGKGLTGRVLEMALENFFLLPLGRQQTTTRIASLAVLIAQEQKITFYDAVYLAHAQEHGVPLVTANPKDHKPMAGIKTIRIEDIV